MKVTQRSLKPHTPINVAIIGTRESPVPRIPPASASMGRYSMYKGVSIQTIWLAMSRTSGSLVNNPFIALSNVKYMVANKTV